MITLQNVSVEIPGSLAENPLLDQINLQISSGEWVALVGKNGSGKSTLAKAIAGLASISSGEATIASVDGNPPLLVFQNPEAQLIGETVYEDICFGLENRGIEPEQMRKIALDALALTGLADRIDDPVSELSGGQKQLLAISSCLALAPSILILDEATSMLPPLVRQSILTVVSRLHQQGLTIIWITQWMDELAHAERVIALANGMIQFEGTPSSFFYEQDAAESDSKEAPFGFSPCERLGLTVPYAVQTAQALMKKGVILNGFPISVQELAVHVENLCQSN